MWARALCGFANRMPATEVHGVASFVYRARAPFHPQRVHDMLNRPLPGVIRAKGHFWVATRPQRAAEFTPQAWADLPDPFARWGRQ